MSYFGIFGVTNSKNYCHIGNQQPRIGQVRKFQGKPRMSKLQSKNASRGHFCARDFRKLMAY